MLFLFEWILAKLSRFQLELVSSRSKVKVHLSVVCVCQCTCGMYLNLSVTISVILMEKNYGNSNSINFCHSTCEFEKFHEVCFRATWQWARFSRRQKVHIMRQTRILKTFFSLQIYLFCFGISVCFAFSLFIYIYVYFARESTLCACCNSIILVIEIMQNIIFLHTHSPCTLITEQV